MDAEWENLVVVVGFVHIIYNTEVVFVAHEHHIAVGKAEFDFFSYGCDVGFVCRVSEYVGELLGVVLRFFGV